MTLNKAYERRTNMECRSNASTVVERRNIRERLSDWRENVCFLYRGYSGDTNKEWIVISGRSYDSVTLTF